MFDYFQQIDKVHVQLDERPFLYQAYVLNFLVEDCLLSILKIWIKEKTWEKNSMRSQIFILKRIVHKKNFNTDLKRELQECSLT